MITRRLLCFSLLVGLLLLLGSSVYSQSKTHPEKATIHLTFSAMHPRANVPDPPAEFIQRGVLDACRSAYQQLPSCLYGFDWIHFRLTAPNKIDSIRITGDYLPEWLTDFYESQVLASQPFWHYADKANNGPIVIALPIDIALQSGCGEERPDNTKYTIEGSALVRLLEHPHALLPDLKAVQQTPKRVVLSPVFLHSVR